MLDKVIPPVQYKLDINKYCFIQHVERECNYIKYMYIQGGNYVFARGLQLYNQTMREIL